MRPSVHTVPVNLVAGPRPALVVGYGKVGRRKTAFLRDCGVDVVVVSPDAGGLEERGVEFVGREFRDEDCAGRMVAFACTSDKRVNRRILEAARRAGTPCCCADMNWADGDFVTPAVTRAGGATVAVSTNGASCAGAKALRQAIGRFLDGMGAGRLMVVGTDDHLLASGRRAACHALLGDAESASRAIFSLKGVAGAAVLSTCTRVEAVVDGDVDEGLVRRMMGLASLREGERFALEGAEAFRHLVKVCAGLGSAWAGEFHVVRQVKDALDAAVSAGTAGGRIRGVFDEVLRVSKLVRHATEGLLDVREIEATAVDYLSSRLDLRTARIAVLGSGALGASVARMLGGCDVAVVHHGEALPDCDALVCALSAPGPVVTSRVPGRVVLDLGMPPNCTEEVGAVSLDVLKDWRRAETGAVDAALAAADEVIDGELKAMEEAGRGF